MRLFLSAVATLVAFTGCSHNNAFDRFEMSAQRERSEESIQSAKLVAENEVQGVATAVYLSRVDPDFYGDAEYFYIYLNSNNNENEPLFILNDSPALLVEELPRENIFTNLTQFSAAWKRYYLVGFAKQNDVKDFKLQIQGEPGNALFLYKAVQE